MPTRKEILEMLAQGRIDVTRATEMLNEASAPPPPPPAPEPAAEPVRFEPDAAAEQGPLMPPTPDRAPEPPMPPARSSSKPRWLHIHVSDLATGRNRVRVNVPLGLVKFGLGVGARFSDEIDPDMMDDVLRALDEEQMSGTLVEVEDLDDNEYVHIFVD